jgi:hypothetical protein
MARAIGADAIENFCFDGEELAARVKGKCRLDDGVSCMVVGKEMLRARSAPLHRPSEQLRRMKHGNIFRIRLLFASECSPDIKRPDLHLLSRHAENVIAQDAVKEVCPLARGNKRESGFVGLVGADATAWLDWIGENPVVDKLHRRHMSGSREGRLDGSAIAVTPGQCHVVRCVRPDRRGPLHDGAFDIRHRRQRFDLGHDFLAGIDGLGDRFGDDQYDWFADVTHPILGERGTWRIGGRIHRKAAKREIRDVANAGSAQVLSGNHSEYAGRAQRLFGMDGPDQPVAMTGTKKDRMGLTRRIYVVGE